MLRIFGFYSFDNYNEEIVCKIRNNFEKKSRFTKFMIFNQGNVFINFETTNSIESKKFYFIDKNKQIACLITGNIYTFEKNHSDISRLTNMAKMITIKYKENGLNFIKNLRGEFNIILVDKNELFLINDGLGLSSMYIHKTKEGYLFCNQAEPIMWLNKHSRIDLGSISEFLVYGFVPNGRTFLKDLYNQQPGTIVRFNRLTISTKKYISFEPLDLQKKSFAQKLQLTKDIFNESVRKRTYNKKLNSF